MDVAFPILLDLPVDEFQTKIVGRLKKGRYVLSEALKTMGVRLSPGSTTGRQLTVVGGWLLALGAFREADRGRKDWDQVFDVADLDDEELASFKLLPIQELVGYKQSLRRFFTLCQLLFENAHPTPTRTHGPLLKVIAKRAAAGSQGGLFFHLDFSYTQPRPGREQSLELRIDENWKSIDQGLEWDSHGTSGALSQFRQMQDPSGLWNAPSPRGADLCLVRARALSSPSGTEATEVFFA